MPALNMFWYKVTGAVDVLALTLLIVRWKRCPALRSC